MFSIENLCEDISEKISKELELDKEKKSVIKYGIFAFIQTIISILVVVIVGFFLKVTVEALIISFTISILRKSSGGVHASSPGRCAIIGAIIAGAMGVVCRNIKLNMLSSFFLAIIIFIWAYFTIYKLAPVDSASKPITNEVKRQRLKKISVKVLSIYLCIIILNIIVYIMKNDEKILSYNMCIYMGITWQIFSLTRSGDFFLKKLDSLLMI